VKLDNLGVTIAYHRHFPCVV